MGKKTKKLYCKNGDLSCGVGLWTCDKCKAEEARDIDRGLTQAQLRYDYDARHNLLGRQDDD